MEILVNKPLIPHNCVMLILRDPRTKELGVGSQVRCDCGREYILSSDYREKYWEPHTFTR